MAETKERKTEKAAEKAKAPRVLNVIGKRKTAVARATIREGSGIIRINSLPLARIQPEIARMRLEEPIRLAPEIAKQLDIDIGVRGGGVMAQASAARQAIARGLLAWSKKPELRNIFITYDRSLLVYDPRQTEPHKFSRSSKGARRRKQLSRR